MNGRLGWIDAISYLAYLVFAALTVAYGPRDALWYVGARPFGRVRGAVVRRALAARTGLLGRARRRVGW